MLEACNQAIELCAENAMVEITNDIELANIKPHYQVKHGTYIIVDKQSILNTKKQIV